MYHYLFTNDLRISNLNTALIKAGECFVTDTVPSASEDKSENNNMKTLGFYFNLTKTSNCAKACQGGNIREVVLNFIKKFQFPNPRTQESLIDTIADDITIAPMRLVLQVLYNMNMVYPGAAHLSRDEILNFFFYNEIAAKTRVPNIVELTQQIIEYRKTGVFPTTVQRDPNKRIWNQEDRQVREMVKLLLYSGCVAENENQELYIQHDNLTLENKAALFEILTYTSFWRADSKQNYNVNRVSYESYMDIEIPEVDTEEDAEGKDLSKFEDIFSGFEPWLTSRNNPDYTGKEKYAGYAKALPKLIKFMYDKGLIEDESLNDKNPDKYKEWVEVYNGSDEAKEYDDKKLSAKAGIAALKKYIKYIEYLIAPHAVDFDYSTTKGDAINKIFYGVPGCGKSHHIQHTVLKGYEKENVIRTTFYQDYSNTDFVGQILPKIVKGENGDRDTVEYIFNPGPFTLALIQAISNPDKKVALVVEEINRGNAPAIFGDIFQLLDRGEDGISEYGIVNVGMMDYLNAHEFEVNGEKKRYAFGEIKIPGNMDIFATMNTSDQNVYTLDTAFTRRWAKERIPNSFNGNELEKWFVPGMDKYTWGEFVAAINAQIQNKLDDLQVNEDKQVGAFFVKKADLLAADHTLSDEDKKAKAISFAHKVLEYLWDDVSKLDHSVIFNPVYKTFEKVVEDYLKVGAAIFNSEIFKN